MKYDLRSDTITKPTDAMRRAMAEAEVGDDVYGEDPTINRLQDMAAELTGKQAALFVPSGSMGNLIAIYLQAGKGREVLTHKSSHIIHYELSSAAAVAGASLIGLDGERGILTGEVIDAAVRPDIYYMPVSGLIEIENTHNKEGGTVYSGKQLRDVRAAADRHGLPVHMDGARIFNASAATGMSVNEISGFTDTITFCISKGLGAPAGSLLCGDSGFIAEARRVRKILGGGMRQAGILAAAGIFALENNVERIADDHAAASKIAQSLAGTAWADIDPDAVETNIIFFKTPGRNAEDVVRALADQGVLCGAGGFDSIRMVTSLALGKDEVETVCSIIRKLELPAGQSL